jgi:hypothetical protein
MFSVRVRLVGDSLHPDECVVAVRTESGNDEILTIDRRSLSDNLLDVGYPVGARNGSVLLEMPRETQRGHWRLWVPRSEIFEVEGIQR